MSLPKYTANVRTGQGTFRRCARHRPGVNCYSRGSSPEHPIPEVSMQRRSFLQAGTAIAALGALPKVSVAQQLPFDPRPAGWRTFEVTTRVEIQFPEGVSRVWLPLPSVEGDYQKPLDNAWSGNGSTRVADDGKYGARMVVSEWSPSEKTP